MPDRYCALPWTHLFISNLGFALPCCIAQSAQADLREPPPQVTGPIDVESLWNSSFQRRIRVDMLAGREPAACRRCFDEEKMGITSSRLRENSRMKDPDWRDHLRRQTAADGHFPPLIQSIDARIGNTCNLKCRMCEPTSSQKLIPEWQRSGHSDLVWEALVAKSQKLGVDADNLTQLYCQTQSLSDIYLVGGEPALTPSYQNALDQLIESGRAKNITLYFCTNGTLMIPRLEKILREFKAVYLYVSIDAAGDLNHYIRHPADWESIKKVLRSLDHLAAKYDRLHVWPHTTVQIYNLAGVTDLIRFLIGENYSNVRKIPFFSLLETPRYFRASLVPPDIKARAVENFESLKRDIFNTLDENCRQNLLEFEKILMSACTTPVDSEAQLEFVKMTRLLDAFRGENVLDVLPELSQLF